MGDIPVSQVIDWIIKGGVAGVLYWVVWSITHEKGGLATRRENTALRDQLVKLEAERDRFIQIAIDDRHVIDRTVNVAADLVKVHKKAEGS